MADEEAPQYPRPDGQHDTNVLSWPQAGAMDQASAPQGGYGQDSGPSVYGTPGYEAPGHGSQHAAGAAPVSGYGTAQDGSGWTHPGPGNPEADYWASRFRRQRLWTRFLVAAIAAALLLFVGGGLFVWKVVVPRATSTVTQGLEGVLPSLPDSGTDGGVPDTSPGSPDSGTDDGASDPNQQDLSDVPLPEALRGLGSALGIDNMEQLLDTAVSMGLMTQEQADRVRAAVANGQSLEGLLGGLGTQSRSGQGGEGQGSSLGQFGGGLMGDGQGRGPGRSGPGSSGGHSQA